MFGISHQELQCAESACRCAGFASVYSKYTYSICELQLSVRTGTCEAIQTLHGSGTVPTALVVLEGVVCAASLVLCASGVSPAVLEALKQCSAAVCIHQCALYSSEAVAAVCIHQCALYSSEAVAAVCIHQCALYSSETVLCNRWRCACLCWRQFDLDLGCSDWQNPTQAVRAQAVRMLPGSVQRWPDTGVWIIRQKDHAVGHHACWRRGCLLVGSHR